MSALPRKANNGRGFVHARFVPKAAIAPFARDYGSRQKRPPTEVAYRTYNAMSEIIRLKA
jgi:hypothetical protein